ncbi:MAG: hypothetical protein U0872_11675 [Planctomycetaceae bacterium]
MFPLVGVVVCLQAGLQLGLAYFAMMVLAVLVHEYGHVFVARGPAARPRKSSSPR